VDSDPSRPARSGLGSRPLLSCHIPSHPSRPGPVCSWAGMAGASSRPLLSSQRFLPGRAQPLSPGDPTPAPGTQHRPRASARAAAPPSSRGPAGPASAGRRGGRIAAPSARRLPGALGRPNTQDGSVRRRLRRSLLHRGSDGKFMHLLCTQSQREVHLVSPTSSQPCRPCPRPLPGRISAAHACPPTGACGVGSQAGHAPGTLCPPAHGAAWSGWCPGPRTGRVSGVRGGQEAEAETEKPRH
jgi:hypothetical protein